MFDVKACFVSVPLITMNNKVLEVLTTSSDVLFVWKKAKRRERL